MARRIMLNGTSYFGQGAIQEIVNEIKNRHFKKPSLHLRQIYLNLKWLLR